MPRTLPCSLLVLTALAALVACTGAEVQPDPTPDAGVVEEGPPPDLDLAGEQAPDLAPIALPMETVLLRGGTIFTGAGPRIEGGSVLLEGGRIKAVSAEAIAAPEGAKIVELGGRFVTPGVIDTHSHLGVYPSPWAEAHSDGNEATSPTTPDVYAEHSIWAQDPGFQRALEGGATTLQILPGSANLIGGRSATVKLHPAVSGRAMHFPGAPWGLKMACGENPKRVYGEKGGKPSTRMGNVAVWRATFLKVREYRDAFIKHQKDQAEWLKDPKPDKKPTPPSRDIGMDTLAAAFEGDILIHVHCYRADDMIQVLELAAEFGFHVRSFHHAVEAYKIRDVLAAREVAVSTWADWWGFKLEAWDAIPENAALVHLAGGRAIIHSDSEIGVQRLNQETAKVLAAARQRGLTITDEDAIRWFTANPAWALGVDDQTGTLEAGKMADVVVWDHHPLTIQARPTLVFVDGVREFDAQRDDAPWSDFEVHSLPGLEERPAQSLPRSRPR